MEKVTKGIKNDKKSAKNYTKWIILSKIICANLIFISSFVICYNLIRRDDHKRRGVKMLNVFDVANWFLSKESMDQKKLQKLCYYAQAWNLVFVGKKMFDGDFEAWVHGPVNRTLWNDLRDYGYFCVDKNRYANRAKSISDETTLSVLNDVWKTYGGYSGYQLELLSHQEEPWIEARNGLSYIQPSNKHINSDTIKKYYSSLVAKSGIGE